MLLKVVRPRGRGAIQFAVVVDVFDEWSHHQGVWQQVQHMKIVDLERGTVAAGCSPRNYELIPKDTTVKLSFPHSDEVETRTVREGLDTRWRRVIATRGKYAGQIGVITGYRSDPRSVRGWITVWYPKAPRLITYRAVPAILESFNCLKGGPNGLPLNVSIVSA
ncbi:hypothetical protein CL629_02665 [bacterium]|nr:hypothetical protein [bacterium]